MFRVIWMPFKRKLSPGIQRSFDTFCNESVMSAFVLFSLKFAMDFSQSFFSNISFAFVTTKLHTKMALKDRFVSLFSFRPLIQNKLEVLGKAGLSEDMLEADCTFFKVFFDIHK